MSTTSAESLFCKISACVHQQDGRTVWKLSSELEALFVRKNEVTSQNLYIDHCFPLINPAFGRFVTLSDKWRHSKSANVLLKQNHHSQMWRCDCRLSKMLYLRSVCDRRVHQGVVGRRSPIRSLGRFTSGTSGRTRLCGDALQRCFQR